MQMSQGRLARVRVAALAVAVLAAAPAMAAAPAVAVPVQMPAFEQPDAQFAQAWRTVPTARASIREGAGPDGSRAAILAPADTPGQAGQQGGAMSQRIDAAPLRARRLRFSAATRVLEGQPTAFLWMRYDDAAGNAIGIVRTPFGNTAWQRVAALGAVPEAAASIVIGAFIQGSGAIAIDDVALESLGASKEGYAAARPLPSRGLSNLRALAQLYGRMRYFHPSDAAATARWDELLWNGVQAVEPTGSDGALREALRQLFCPIGRGVVFGAPPPARDPPREGFIAWRHVGFGDSTMRGIYASRRELAPADLPGYSTLRVSGIDVAIPLKLTLEAARSGPAPDCPAQAGSMPEAFVYSVEDRTTRLVSVIQAWSVLRHFYPYFDVVPGSWDAELTRALQAAASGEGEPAFLRTLQQLTAALHDGHARVYPPMAIGRLPLEWAVIEGQLVVTESDVASVQRGDVVEAVDGEPPAQRLRSLEARVSGATQGWRRQRALEELQAAPMGATRTLRLRRADGSLHTAGLAVVPPTQALAPKSRPAQMAELAPGVRYVDLTRIQADELAVHADTLAKARGYLFDLRGYPTGPAMTVIQRLAAGNVKSDQFRLPTFQEPEQRHATFRDVSWDLPPLQPHFAGKAVFLTDARAISYAESLLGTVAGNRLGVVVGARTAGTNGNIAGFALASGHQISWTGMQVRKPDGSVFHGVGIVPDVPVSPTLRDLRAGVDTVLEAGLAVLRGARD